MRYYSTAVGAVSLDTCVLCPHGTFSDDPSGAAACTSYADDDDDVDDDASVKSSASSLASGTPLLWIAAFDPNLAGALPRQWLNVRQSAHAVASITADLTSSGDGDGGGDGGIAGSGDDDNGTVLRLYGYGSGVVCVLVLLLVVYMLDTRVLPRVAFARFDVTLLSSFQRASERVVQGRLQHVKQPRDGALMLTLITSFNENVCERHADVCASRVCSQCDRPRHGP
jgi:hypothetical protein